VLETPLQAGSLFLRTSPGACAIHAANVFTEDPRTCLEAGMNDFVANPVELDSLFATIIMWLRRPDSKKPE
jgi:DNA-binding response OmpR family regulator